MSSRCEISFRSLTGLQWAHSTPQRVAQAGRGSYSSLQAIATCLSSLFGEAPNFVGIILRLFELWQFRAGI